jgi:hypothetical protein
LNQLRVSLHRTDELNPAGLVQVTEHIVHGLLFESMLEGVAHG